MYRRKYNNKWYALTGREMQQLRRRFNPENFETPKDRSGTTGFINEAVCPTCKKYLLLKCKGCTFTVEREREIGGCLILMRKIAKESYVLRLGREKVWFPHWQAVEAMVALTKLYNFLLGFKKC